jgi:hypothetical protein
MKTENLYLAEKTGETRQIFGPYSTIQAARKEAGVRYAIVTGRGLSNGLTMRRGEFAVAVQNGRIRPVDPIVLS